ncbi:MAG TPA: glycosyltransferase family 25 protein [Pyrinomonadaceae bacterium]|jgi:GR25 family glycosyltransferase involved in LPS biosynthesis
MNLNEFFPHIVCINLDRRPERWRRARNQFARHDINPVVRFPALDGAKLELPPGWKEHAGIYGCLQSHLAVVREARESGLPRLMIFEDDAVLDANFNAKFSHYVAQLPQRWDMLLFGGLHVFVRPAMVADNICKVTQTYSTFAYALNHTIFDAFIELNSHALEAVDKGNVKLQQAFDCYCFMPHLAWVEENYSDTQGQPSNPWYIKESLVMMSPELDDIQRTTALIIPHHNGKRNQTATRNLQHIVRFYAKYFPSIAVLIVEQDVQSTIDPRTLPVGCRYELLRDASNFNRDHCLRRGVEIFESSKQFFIFAEDNIHLEREFVVANLEMCLQYDFVCPYDCVLDLNAEDTRRIIDEQEIDAAEYRTRARRRNARGAWFITRRGMQRLGESSVLHRGMNVGEAIRALRTNEEVSVFESPNRALRLHDGGREE